MSKPSEKKHKPSSAEFSAQVFGHSERWAVYAEIIRQEDDVFRPNEVAAEAGVHVSVVLETAQALEKAGVLTKAVRSDTFTRNPDVDWDTIDAGFAELSRAISEE